ncbi:hypothetical protein, partial [Polymorphobacter sp.]|uniref:hypothetical protein n=1 Tax=Polymorphobacter sp. TaxID=1909290 RepID=UPI003F7008EF
QAPDPDYLAVMSFANPRFWTGRFRPNRPFTPHLATPKPAVDGRGAKATIHTHEGNITGSFDCLLRVFGRMPEYRGFAQPLA